MPDDSPSSASRPGAAASAAACRKDFDFGKLLGRGSFGSVLKVLRKADGRAFVCKEINLKGMKGQAREEANQEVELLRRISSGSQYIVDYIDSFLEKETLHIVMEFCEHGDLSGYMKARSGKNIEEATIWKFAIQIGLGLQWLHTNRILHRDIKSLNVFLTTSDDVRLGDLGVARVLSAGDAFASTLIGTPYYLSPEMCEQKPYNEKSDVWAYGCVAYEMCALSHPFEAKNNMQLVVKIISGKYEPIPDSYPVELRSFVTKCLAHKAADRPQIAALLLEDAPRGWAARLEIPLPGETADPLRHTAGWDPERINAKKKWRKLRAQIHEQHEEVVRRLDAPSRLAWDSLYRMLWAQMGVDSELPEEEVYSKVEKYVFEELKPEHTDLILKACKILPLEQECDRCRAIWEAPERLPAISEASETQLPGMVEPVAS